MGVGRIFPGGSIVVLPRGPERDLPQGTNSGIISFYQLETKGKSFFCKNVNGKISTFKIQGAKTPASPFPTPMGTRKVNTIKLNIARSGN